MFVFYGSKYATDDPYLEIQSELLRYCAESKHILLLGDFSSRTGTLSDYMEVDEKICEINSMKDLYNENVEILDMLNFNNIPLVRNNSDRTVNTYGRQLIELCRNNNLFILNGRIGQERINTKVTRKDCSVVDYFLATACNFAFINGFYVQDFSDLYSDAHCPLSLTINVKEVTNGNLSTNNTVNSKFEIEIEKLGLRKI